MFDFIILQAGPAERNLLRSCLIGHRPQLTVILVDTAADLDALDGGLLRRARLVAFVTPVIVPERILAQLGYGAFNFHPGPPSYPGWAPAHFALYHRETEFGATAHVMVEAVDAGPIIDVARFPIPKGTTVLALEGLAYAHLALLFWRLAKALATEAEPPAALPIKWGAKKYSRRAYRAMCDIPLDISKEEFERRMRIFGDNHFGISPTIDLHGIQFRAVTPPAQSAEQAVAGNESLAMKTARARLVPSGSPKFLPPQRGENENAGAELEQAAQRRVLP